MHAVGRQGKTHVDTERTSNWRGEEEVAGREGREKGVCVYVWDSQVVLYSTVHLLNVLLWSP